MIAVVRDLNTREAGKTVVAMHRDDGRRFSLPVPHDIHRIDVLDGDAVMVGPDGDHGLRMTAVAFSPEPRVHVRAVADEQRQAFGPMYLSRAKERPALDDVLYRKSVAVRAPSKVGIGAGLEQGTHDNPIVEDGLAEHSG